MIIRKPSAFIIKHFRLIHFIITLLIAFSIYKAFNINVFFTNFEKGILPNINNFSAHYFDITLFLDIILVIILNLTISILMISKKQKAKIYITTIFYYLFLLFILNIFNGFIKNIDIQIFSSQTLRFYRDFSLIIYLIQYFFLIFFLIRTIGLNLKNFEFNDKNNLETSEEDSEEVEVSLKIKNYKIERATRKSIRNLKIYLRENLFIIFNIVALLVISLGIYLFLNRTVINPTYKEGEAFKYKEIEVKNISSILSPLSQNGEILPQNKYYLAIKFSFKTITKQALNIKDFRVIIGGESITPVINKSDYFIDYGVGYNGQLLDANTGYEYIFLYELTKDKIQDSYFLRIVNNISYADGSAKASYKNLIVFPKLLDKIDVVGKYKLNENINLNKSILETGNILFKDYKIMDSFTYTYQNCDAGECTDVSATVRPDQLASRPRVLIVLNYEDSLKNTYFETKEKIFFSKFTKLHYGSETDIRELGIVNKTPLNLNNTLIIEADANINEFSILNLLIKIRNKEYVILLK